MVNKCKDNIMYRRTQWLQGIGISIDIIFDNIVQSKLL